MGCLKRDKQNYCSFSLNPGLLPIIFFSSEAGATLIRIKYMYMYMPISSNSL